MDKNEFKIRLAAVWTSIFSRLAHFSNLTWTFLNKKIGTSSVLLRSKLPTVLSFKNFSKRILSLVSSNTQATKSLIVSITKRLYFFAKSSIQSIVKRFVKWFRKTFFGYKGIAIVCGLEYAPMITQATKELINTYPIRFNMLSSPIQPLHKAPMEFTSLFFQNLTEENLKAFEKIRTIISVQPTLTLNDTIDYIRIHLGKLFLLKQVYEPKLFSILAYILTPEEAKWLRKKGYYLLYLQTKDPSWLTRYCSGFTFGSMIFHKCIFDEITSSLLRDLIERVYLGEKI